MASIWSIIKTAVPFVSIIHKIHAAVYAIILGRHRLRNQPPCRREATPSLEHPATPANKSSKNTSQSCSCLKSCGPNHDWDGGADCAVTQSATLAEIVTNMEQNGTRKAFNRINRVLP
jgi:hypothetical protein